MAALGASQYLYAEATRTQQLPDWIGSHVRTFEYLGGVTEIVVPDNLKSGVSRACRYEPDINPTYADLASHYGTAVIPARVRKPKDKAKVESGVQIVEREILARLRDRQFFSSGRAQPCDPGAAGGGQPAPLPETGCLPPGPVRAAGSTGAEALAASGPMSTASS